MQDIKNRFDKAYQSASNFKVSTEVIGIQKEKILHRTLKYYISNNEANHEVKIKKTLKGILYADVLIDYHIYEIQTRSFNQLRNKLDEFLKQYQVTIVYPIAYKKNIYKIDANGEIFGPKKSPKTGNVFDVFKELYKIKSYLNNDNLDLKIIYLEIDEYRNIVEKKYSKNSGYIREIQIPKKIYQEINLKNINDYISYLNQYDLPEEFTSTTFSKIVHIRKPLATITLNILTYLKVVERIGKIKNSYIYKKRVSIQ